MYKRHLNQVNLLDEPEMFGGIKLNKENQWVKLAKMIPLGKLEEKYAEQFSDRTGNPACSFRMALGSLIIKENHRAEAVHDRRAVQRMPDDTVPAADHAGNDERDQ